ncbi:MAG: pyruvate kinase [Candidatus Peribacteraceae bacterium]|nr:pyruvate kinase [Candidatus Peribacteraceae bacterium]
MMRLTKTICTLGPASNNEEGIRKLAERGMSIARMNFSHGTQETHSAVVESIRKVNAEGGFNVGLLLDTKGAEIRTGDRPEPIQVNAGDTVVFSFAKDTDEFPVIKVNYPEFWKDAKDARFILIDSGELMMDIVKIEEDRVVAKSQGTYAIGSRRHINLPGADVTLPSLAEKDWSDIELGCKLKLDYIAMSFIRKGSEVDEVRAFVTKHGHPDILLISKIENGVGVDNIDEIIAASDGIMIARGDLGAEIPLETLPFVQDDIAARCRKAGKPVIMATQMLESMIKNPMPTRAEVTDVAHAVHLGVDSTMLSGETAAGKYPFVALETMIRIAKETEKHTKPSMPKAASDGRADQKAAAAVALAQGEKATAIVVYAKTGATARAISRLRPNVPVYLCATNADVLRRHQLFFALHPLKLEGEGVDASAALKKKGLLAAGDKVVVVKAEATLSTIA